MKCRWCHIDLIEQVHADPEDNIVPELYECPRCLADFKVRNGKIIGFSFNVKVNIKEERKRARRQAWAYKRRVEERRKARVAWKNKFQYRVEYA